MISKLRFDPDSRVIVRGHAYRSPELTEEGYKMVSEQTGEIKNFCHSALVTAYATRKLRYDYRYHAAPNVEVRKRRAHPSQQQLSPAQARALKWREGFCQKFLALEQAARTSRALPAMIATIREIQVTLVQEISATGQAGTAYGRAGNAITICHPPSPRTLRRWLARYARGGAMALRPAYSRCGNRNQRFPVETTTLMNRFLSEYSDERRPTIAACHQAMLDYFISTNTERYQQGLPELKPPSRAAFTRRLRGENQFRQYANRYGKAAAIAKFYGGHGGVKVTIPLERAEADECTLDIFALVTDRRIFELLSPEDRRDIARTRYYLTAIIDCATRYVLSIVLSETPSAASALRALKLSLTDKDEIATQHGAITPWSGAGLISELVTDNGSSFIDADFRETCALLGITLTHAPAGRPQLRATIERFFHTLSLETISLFTGQTFSDPVKKGDYPSEQRATLTRDELASVLVRAVADIYHNTPHRGLHNETPRQAWDRLTDEFGISPAPNPTQMMTAFGLEYERTTSINGVLFNGLWYHNTELQNYRMQHGDGRLAIRVDIDRLNDIVVKLDKDWVLIPATDQVAATTTLAQLKLENVYLNKHFHNQNKVGRMAAQKARQDFRELHANALRRAAIGPTVLNKAQLHHAESEVLLGSTSLMTTTSATRLPTTFTIRSPQAVGFRNRIGKSQRLRLQPRPNQKPMARAHSENGGSSNHHGRHFAQRGASCSSGYHRTPQNDPCHDWPRR